jgi:hypothetical protein
MMEKAVIISLAIFFVGRPACVVQPFQQTPSRATLPLLSRVTPWTPQKAEAAHCFKPFNRRSAFLMPDIQHKNFIQQSALSAKSADENPEATFDEEEYEYVDEDEEMDEDEEYEYIYEDEEVEVEEDDRDLAAEIAVSNEYTMEFGEEEEEEDETDEDLEKIDPDFINIDKEYMEVMEDERERTLNNLLAKHDAEVEDTVEKTSSLLATRNDISEEEATEYFEMLKSVKDQVYNTPEKLKELEEDAITADIVMQEYEKLPDRISGAEDIIPDGMQYDDVVVLETVDPITNETVKFAAGKEELQSVGDKIEALRKVEQEMADFKNRIDFMDVDAAMEALDATGREDVMQFDMRFTAGEGGIDIEDFEDNRREHLFNYQFNVTNLMLSSFKVNPDAPVVKEEWMEALRYQKKYEHVREFLDFNFTWHDVDAANETELEEYWRLTGVDEIPKPSRRENPNVVQWDENPLTFEEEQMLSLEAWYEEVYHDQDDMMLEEEVDEKEAFAESDDKQDPTEVEVEKFEKKWAGESEEWKRQFYTKYEREHSTEETDDVKQFRGHLVVACGDDEDDLEVAGSVTNRMREDFGPQVFVETRVHSHAKTDDSIFEIWLESWDIELLHSKRRATFDREWEGPKDVDEDQMKYLVDKVRFLISDESRFSFNFKEFADVVEG